MRRFPTASHRIGNSKPTIISFLPSQNPTVDVSMLYLYQRRLFSCAEDCMSARPLFQIGHASGTEEAKPRAAMVVSLCSRNEAETKGGLVDET